MATGNWVERRRALVYPALMSLGVGVLGSCADRAPSQPARTVAVEPPPPPPPSPPAPRFFRLPPHKPTPPPENVGGEPYTGTESMALATPEPNVRVPSANQLIGLDQAGAKRLLGAATEQSDAPPATVWRYRNATCELDLFFYLDLRSGKMRTLHYAFKGDAADREDCLRSLVVARGA